MGSQLAVGSGPATVSCGVVPGTQDLLTRESSEGAGIGARPEEPKLARGTAVGRYLLGDPLGEGGMGVVYSAWDPELDRGVAIKLVRVAGKSALAREEARLRLLREAKAMARLSHPAVVAVHDAGTWRDQVFLAMELVRGSRTVPRWLAEKPRHWKEVLQVFREAGQGIASAHAAGLVHRDIKPENILVDDAGHARVTDFGIAHLESELPPVTPPGVPPHAIATPSLGIGVSDSGDLTLPGCVMGTPDYLAPELFRQAKADARSDEFSFCVALHIALYGARPYTSNKIPAGAATSPPEPPEKSEVPLWVRKPLLKGLSVEPSARYPSMEALLSALEGPPVRRLGHLGLAVGLVAALAVPLSIFLHRPARAGLCGERDPLSGIWDAASQSSIRHAFQTVDPGGEAWIHTQAGLDAFASDWSGRVGTSCRAKEDEVVLARLGCLERERDHLRALTALLGAPDAGVVQHAPVAAASLPRPAQCDDARLSSPAERVPVDAEARRRSAAFRLTLADANAQAATGRFDQAVSALNALAVQATSLGDRALEAEALFDLGLALDEAGKEQAAEDALGRTVLAAEAAGNDGIAARAAARYGSLLAMYRNQPGEARKWVARAQASIERMGGDVWGEAEVALARFNADETEGKTANLVPEAEKIWEMDRELLGPAHPDSLRARYHLAEALEEQGRFEEALAVLVELTATAEHALGRDHPSVSRPLIFQAELFLELGRLDQADQAVSRAIPLAQRTEGGTIIETNAWMTLAQLRLAQHRTREALEAIRRGEALASSSAGNESAPYQAALGMEGEIRLALGEPGRALAIISRAVALDPTDEVALAFKGEALLALSRPTAALPLLEKANRMMDDRHQALPEPPRVMARVRFDLARALACTGGSRNRARALAREALKTLAPYPWQAEQRETIQRWLGS